MGENKDLPELNSIMMRNTFKIEGEGSIGSCFLIGKPIKKDPDWSYYVIVTAAHVLEQMKGEEATIYLRRKQNDDLFEKLPWKIKIRQDGSDMWVKNKSGIDVAAMYVKLPNDADFQLLNINSPIKLTL